ncbi:hypothetical protein ACIA8K_32520 [Catenuloplanes sp. NPDC051500]|uniref:hypothetical protein n=1 Tax=Catenuloplanes sp. NPDC051500 TaxID=3363959 RepID=UPI0037A89668
MNRPLYVRVLRLRYVSPGGLLCFVYFEGAFGLGVLLALAELVTWWGVLVLPASIALMVKLNDVMAGVAAVRSATPRRAQGGAGDAVRRSLARRTAARAAGAVPGPVGAVPGPVVPGQVSRVFDGAAAEVYGAALARGAADLHGAANSHAGLTGGHGTLAEQARVEASRARTVRAAAVRNERSGAEAVPDQAVRVAAARIEGPWGSGSQDQGFQAAADSRAAAVHDDGVRAGAGRDGNAWSGTGTPQGVRPARAGATRGVGGARFAGQRVDSTRPVSGAVYRASGEAYGAFEDSGDSRDMAGMHGGRGGNSRNSEAQDGNSRNGEARDGEAQDGNSRDGEARFYGGEPSVAPVAGQAVFRSTPADRAPIPTAPRDAVGPQRTPGGRRPNDSHRLVPPPGRGTPPGRAPMTGGAPAARRAADGGTHRFPDRPAESWDGRQPYRGPADGTARQAPGAAGVGRRPAESTGRHDSDLRTDDRFTATGHPDTPQQRARQSGTRRYE